VGVAVVVAEGVLVRVAVRVGLAVFEPATPGLAVKVFVMGLRLWRRRLGRRIESWVIVEPMGSIKQNSLVGRGSF
jgi:hypothetical protein